MAGVNKAIVLGNLGDKPDLRYTQSGTAVANVSLATNEKKKDRDGNWIDHTEWHKLVFWGKTAEVLAKYAGKGKQIYVEGKLRTRRYEDKETGKARFSTEIVVDNLVLLGSKDDGGDRRREREETESADYGSGTRDSAAAATKQGEEYRDDEDDLPF